MFRNNIYTVFLFGSLCAGVTTASAEVIFSDSFETGNLAATSADGFKWGGPNKTSVVTQDAVDGSVNLYDGKGATHEVLSDLMPDGSDRDYTTNFGENSLRFRYDALNSGAREPEWTEQRFDLGKGYPEIWISYYIRVPLNYHRGPNSPTQGNNNTWFLLLMGNMSNYNNSEVTLFSNLDRLESWSDGSSIKLSSTIRMGGGGYAGETKGYVNFVTPADAGRWMEVIYYLRASPAKGVDGSGAYRMYRRWVDESSATLIDSIDPAYMPITQASIDAGYNGWGGGYFMGWLNNPYAEETEWLIDNLIISTTSLLPNPPKSPVSVKGGVIK